MSNYSNGRAAEYKTMHFYERQGYECIRAAGSHGVFDVVAIGRHDVKLIQVKKGRKLSASEEAEMLEAIRLVECPGSCQKLVVEWKFRQKMPIVKEL